MAGNEITSSTRISFGLKEWAGIGVVLASIFASHLNLNYNVSENRRDIDKAVEGLKEAGEKMDKMSGRFEAVIRLDERVNQCERRIEKLERLRT